MELSKMSDTALVTKLTKIKEKQMAAKAEYDAVAAELQRRAIPSIEDKNKKFVRYQSSKGMVTVCQKQGLTLISPTSLRNTIGADLFDDEFKVSKETTYKPKTAFEFALKAIVTKDYDFSLEMDQVFDSLEASPKERVLLTKKLKGDYVKDLGLLISVFGEGDYDTELYCIYKIKAAEAIDAFFPGKDEEFFDELRKLMVVSDGISITLTQKDGE